MSKKKIRFFYWMFLALGYIGLFTPILVLIIKEWDTYFMQKQGITVSLGGMLAIGGVALLGKYGFKKFNKIFWSTIFLGVVYCFNSIIQHSLPITFCVWLGTLIFFVFEFPMKYYKKLLYAYTEEQVRTHAREETKTTIAKKSGRV